MKILIIGAGRMGIRHLQGVLSIKEVEQVTILDINQDALNNALQVTKNDKRLQICLLKDFIPISHDVCIIASTAKDRKTLIELAVKCRCKNLMVEKPLGQSFEEVLELINYIDKLPLTAVVNLNQRQYEVVKKLKQDLQSIPQLQGDKNITLNTGSLGIGCNGIHFLDKIFFLLGADEAKIIDAEIEETLIPSGRGKEFCDFGGWAVVKFYKMNKYQGRLLISMSSVSSAFGGWEIITSFGRIIIDEIAATRTTVLRKADSKMPLNRYGADYQTPIVENYQAPFLGDLTADWIFSLLEGKNALPELKESLKAHKLMFDWLAFSKTHKKKYPIT